MVARNLMTAPRAVNPDRSLGASGSLQEAPAGQIEAGCLGLERITGAPPCWAPSLKDTTALLNCADVTLYCSHVVLRGAAK